MADHSDSHKVGYRNPPKHSRFPKGESGNPRGRPRQAPSFKSALAAELQETTEIIEGGKRLTMTKQQALFRMLTTAAVKDVRAASVLLDIARKYGVGVESDTRERDAEDDVDLLHEYVEQEQSRRARASSDFAAPETKGDDNG